MNMITKLAHRLMLVAAAILMFAGIPQPHINFTNIDNKPTIEITAIESVVLAHDRNLHACGDEPKTENTDKHALKHCGIFQWIALGTALVVAAAGLAALIAAKAASGAFLGLAAIVWKWIVASGVAATAIMWVVYNVCNPNAGNICDQPRT